LLTAQHGRTSNQLKFQRVRAKITTRVVTVVLMLHLFVSPISFQNWGEYPPDWTSLSQLFAELVVAVSFAALTLALCRALAFLLFGELLAVSDSFGPPPSQHLTPNV
jgi:hypothetical protein